MMRILIFISMLLPFISNAQLKVFGNAGYNVNGNRFYLINTSDTIASFRTDSIKFYKPTNIGGGIASINSMTGPAITLTTGTGLTSSSGSNTFTVSYDANSTDVHNVLDKTFTSVNNSGTSETDLYSYTLPANKLVNAGASIHMVYTGTNNDATATSQIQAYFAGNNVYNSTALAISAIGDWRIEVDVMRVTSTTARVSAKFFADNATVGTPIKYTALTSLDFTTTNIFKVTGTAAGATGGSNDITGTVGKIIFEP